MIERVSTPRRGRLRCRRCRSDFSTKVAFRDFVVVAAVAVADVEVGADDGADRRLKTLSRSRMTEKQRRSVRAEDVWKKMLRHRHRHRARALSTPSPRRPIGVRR